MAKVTKHEINFEERDQDLGHENAQRSGGDGMYAWRTHAHTYTQTSHFKPTGGNITLQIYFSMSLRRDFVIGNAGGKSGKWCVGSNNKRSAVAFQFSDYFQIAEGEGITAQSEALLQLAPGTHASWLKTGTITQKQELWPEQGNTQWDMQLQFQSNGL